MAISIIQSASSLQPAQSPVIFSVSVPSPQYTASRFQYTCKLDYWTNPSATSSITILKYPNQAGSGIFDFSKVLSSTLQDNLIETTSSITAYKATFNYVYYTGATFASGSDVSSSVLSVYDGYALTPEAINANISTRGLYPLLTDGPATQSVLLTDKGTLAFAFSGTASYVGSNGSTANVIVLAGTATSNTTKRIPIGPGETNFPISKTGLTHFTVSSGGKSIRFNVDCESKYTPIRIAFKNRFGQLDFFNFYKVSTRSFATTQRTFQPNIGNWNSSTFSLNGYKNQTQRYIVDNEQSISVTSDYIKEEYNEILKQLLVSDEIYWYNGSDIVPVSIATSNIEFKTGVKDKLINYKLDFSIGRNYKQIV